MKKHFIKVLFEKRIGVFARRRRKFLGVFLPAAGEKFGGGKMFIYGENQKNNAVLHQINTQHLKLRSLESVSKTIEKQL